LASASFSAATQKLASSVLDSRQPNTLRPCQLRQRPLFGQGRQRYLRLESRRMIPSFSSHRSISFSQRILKEIHLTHFPRSGVDFFIQGGTTKQSAANNLSRLTEGERLWRPEKIAAVAVAP
jgi:hypothetical protein